MLKPNQCILQDECLKETNMFEKRMLKINQYILQYIVIKNVCSKLIYCNKGCLNHIYILCCII